MRGNQIQTLQLSTQNNGSKATWNLRGLHFLTRPMPFRLCIILVRGGDADIPTRALPPALTTYLNTVHIRTNGDPILASAVNNGDRATFINNLEAAWNTAGRAGNVSLIIAILPSKDAAQYAYLKWWGDCRIGVPTICVTRGAIRDNFNANSINNNFLGNLRQVNESLYPAT
jgi:hypothetical protein